MAALQNVNYSNFPSMIPEGYLDERGRMLSEEEVAGIDRGAVVNGTHYLGEVTLDSPKQELVRAVDTAAGTIFLACYPKRDQVYYAQNIDTGEWHVVKKEIEVTPNSRGKDEGEALKRRGLLVGRFSCKGSNHMWNTDYSMLQTFPNRYFRSFGGMFASIRKSPNPAHQAIVAELLAREDLPEDARYLLKVKEPMAVVKDDSYLIMPYFHGKQFSEVFRSIENEDGKIRLIANVISSLQVVHDLQIVHGDFHSENFLIGEDGNVMIYDHDNSALLDKDPTPPPSLGNGEFPGGSDYV